MFDATVSEHHHQQQQHRASLTVLIMFSLMILTDRRADDCEWNKLFTHDVSGATELTLHWSLTHQSCAVILSYTRSAAVNLSIYHHAREKNITPLLFTWVSHEQSNLRWTDILRNSCLRIAGKYVGKARAGKWGNIEGKLQQQLRRRDACMHWKQIKKGLVFQYKSFKHDCDAC